MPRGMVRSINFTSLLLLEWDADLPDYPD